MKRTLVVVASLIAVTSIGAQNPPKTPPPQVPPGANSWAYPPPRDPFAACMFSPEDVMMHQQEIALTDEQRTKLIAEMSRAQAKATETQWTLSAEQSKLQKAVQPAVVDETAVLKQVDRILAIEQDMKRAQMTLMVRVKNTLTAEQQAKLRAMRPDFVWGPALADRRVPQTVRGDSASRVYWTVPDPNVRGAPGSGC
jgi:Spy/CpxP family protein refolding chaperone